MDPIRITLLPSRSSVLKIEQVKIDILLTFQLLTYLQITEMYN